MTHLLDVNVLIALLDRWHVFHDLAHDWFERIGWRRWATCPITENGVVRIIGHPRYEKGPGSTIMAATLLRSLLKREGHSFWPDDISLGDEELFDREKFGSSGQMTDTYLLALAAHHGGKFATFDRRLSAAAVRGGREALHVIA